MGLFNSKKEVSISSIKIDTYNWTEDSESNDQLRIWVNPYETALVSVNFFKIEPDLPTIKDANALRWYYRYLLGDNGGIVEVDLIMMHTIPALKTIIKIPQSPTGMTYIGAITIPFESNSYVLKVQAIEEGMTGVRESVVLAKAYQEGLLKLEEGMDGWFCDPYDKDFKSKVMMGLSDDKKYDIQFENHPLSIVRKIMSDFESKTQFESEIASLKGFNK